MPKKLMDLDTLKGLLGLEKQAFIERYGIKASQVRSDAQYERMAHVDDIYNPELSPAHFFFQRAKLALIYMGDTTVLSSLNAETIKARFGGDGVELRSRAGKTSNLHVYPEQGVAISIGDEVDFFELFPPMSINDYKHKIYENIESFRK